MDLICPDCRSALQMANARQAVCAQHGGRFEVLFDRYALPAPAPAATPALPDDAMCAAHERQKAIAACPACSKHLCALCAFEVHGQRYCGDCASTAASQPAANIAPQAVYRRTNDGPPAQCAVHPDSIAVATCRLCTKPVCATCDFAMPGGVHFCPSCVEASQSAPEISPKRKKLSYIALALAVWSTFMLVLLFSGALNSFSTDDKAGEGFNQIFGTVTFWPMLIGTGLAMGAIDRKLKNTTLMKVTLWWNCILSGIFLILIVIGSLT